MNWRLRLAEWLVRDTPYMVVSAEVVGEYFRILAEERKVLEFLTAHPQLQPTFEILKPSKQKRERLH